MRQHTSGWMVISVSCSKGQQHCCGRTARFIDLLQRGPHTPLGAVGISVKGLELGDFQGGLKQGFALGCAVRT